MSRTPRDGDGQGTMSSLFAAGGELGRDLQAVDWPATPLGDPESWPRSLKTIVRVVLSSRFSMWMAWGPDLTFLCNEPYRKDTLGAKYPWALAKPAREVWSEIWSEIWPRVDSVMRTGRATWDESLLLFLERSGYREETYHTFSYSPLTDDDGRIAGMLCVVIENTDQVIGERRMAMLRDVGSVLSGARDESAVFSGLDRHLGGASHTLPFLLVYLFDADGHTARLRCAVGTTVGAAVAPATLSSVETAPPWPVTEALENRTVLVEELGARFASVPSGGWDEPPSCALVVPLLAPTQLRPTGFLVAALTPHRPADTGYEGFVRLLASQVATAIANARAYDAERQRAEALAQLDRAKTTFFTNVSHEFRTPLTLLLGPAEDALGDTGQPLAPVQRERVELVHRNGERLLKLVNTLLDFSRLESGQMAARLQATDLSRETLDIVAMFRAAAERAGLHLAASCPPLDRLVLVDREMWAKIVSNLLSNALKHTFEGEIALRLERSTSKGAPDIVLEVRDTGIGIAPEDQEHLFERFHRVSGARSRTFEGSGIGLALVAELAEMHGGGVTAKSAPGVGSTFTVRIPLVAAPHSPDTVDDGTGGELALAEQVASPFVAEATEWLGHGDGDEDLTARRRTSNDEMAARHEDARPRVLVADDNADMRSYIASLLSDRYQVTLARDGAEALEMAQAELPDVVLTDVMMPRLDGFALLGALRTHPSTAHVPVVMLSARAGDGAAVEGLDAGADDYVTKPFSALELTARVRSSLELERARRDAGRDRRLLDELRSNRELLAQAQRLARLGSWELDFATGSIHASDELLSMLRTTAEELDALGLDGILDRYVHPGDRDRLAAALEAGIAGEPIAIECRLLDAKGVERLCDIRGEVVRSVTGQVPNPESDAAGAPVTLRGSLQDVTQQRLTERALAAGDLARETAREEHRIAEDLQHSLVPARVSSTDHLDVATYYQAGIRGTQVGGDWYDVVDIGAGRTALVIGDVMGRGVRAAALMGQVRATARAYARLGLSPAELLEQMDAIVRDLDGGQIVTCIYAVHDPVARTLTYANAGHLPPLLRSREERARRLTAVLGPPLGAGPAALNEESVPLEPGSLVALYTDGLVERRDRPIDEGIDVMAALLDAHREPLAELTTLVDTLCPDGCDDDVAVLVAATPEAPASWATAEFELPGAKSAVSTARSVVARTLSNWGIDGETTQDAILLASELTTNALVHGEPPVTMRLCRMKSELLIEVLDRASFRPRRRRPAFDDEHGRGLQIVAGLADDWGTRVTESGKSVWCIISLPGG